MEERRRKLRFRAWRRGFREMDMIMGAFADAEIETLSEAELDAFEALLDVPDWEVWSWLTGEAVAGPAYQGPVLDKLMVFKPGIQAG